MTKFIAGFLAAIAAFIAVFITSHEAYVTKQGSCIVVQYEGSWIETGSCSMRHIAKVK